jgi:hypothetical protein
VIAGFEAMRFDISDLPTGTAVIEKYTELAEHAEFSNDVYDKLLRIAMFATDEKSPFVKLEREDYEKRLQKIFEFLKIKDDELLRDLSLGKNVVYENMVNRFFMITDNLAYVMWSNKLRMFHYISISLRQAPDMNNIVTDMTNRAKLDVQLKTIYNDLVEYESQVFTDIPTRNKLRKQLAKLIQPAEQFAVTKQVI